MAWTTPYTWTDDDIWDPDLMNVQIRDNLNETMPAKAALPNQFFRVNDSGNVVGRVAVYSDISQADFTTASVYGDLENRRGPSVRLEVGTSALVEITARIRSTGSHAGAVSCRVTGSTQIGFSDTRALIQAGTSAHSASHAMVYDGLNPGMHRFELKYRTFSVGNAVNFFYRRIAVRAL